MLVDLTIKGFLAETAGSAPVPGGGSISALNGAIATALTEMVANLTIGKKKYADVEGQMSVAPCACRTFGNLLRCLLRTRRFLGRTKRTFVESSPQPAFQTETSCR